VEKSAVYAGRQSILNRNAASKRLKKVVALKGRGGSLGVSTNETRSERRAKPPNRPISIFLTGLQTFFPQDGEPFSFFAI
jgi:hypothetical protein